MTFKMIKRSVIAAVVIGALCAPVFAAGAQSPVPSDVGFNSAKITELKAPPPPMKENPKPPKPPKKVKKPKPPKPPKPPKKSKKKDKRPNQPPPPPQPPRR